MYYCTVLLSYLDMPVQLFYNDDVRISFEGWKTQRGVCPFMRD